MPWGVSPTVAFLLYCFVGSLTLWGDNYTNETSIYRFHTKLADEEVVSFLDRGRRVSRLVLASEWTTIKRLLTRSLSSIPAFIFMSVDLSYATLLRWEGNLNVRNFINCAQHFPSAIFPRLILRICKQIYKILNKPLLRMRELDILQFFSSFAFHIHRLIALLLPLCLAGTRKYNLQKKEIKRYQNCALFPPLIYPCFISQARVGKFLRNIVCSLSCPSPYRASSATLQASA